MQIDQKSVIRYHGNRMFVYFSLVTFLYSFNPITASHPTLGQEKLVKIVSKIELETLLNLGISQIADYDKNIFAKVNKQDIEKLDELQLNYTVLDSLCTGEYYFAWLTEAESALGLDKVIFVNQDFFIIRVSTPAELNRLLQERVELRKINFTPSVYNRAKIALPPVVYDPTIQAIVDRVSADSVFGLVRRLVSFQTRYSTTDSARACANYIKEKLEGYGLDSVYWQEFSPTYAPNVIGIKRGQIYPESIYTVICGHFDCTSGSPYTFAPGADDNGSGASSVLEAARVMQDYNFNYSIRFIAFCGEEQGLIGSNYYASQARNRGDSIIGVINVDMVAYSLPNRDSASIIGKPENPNCAPLVDYFIACADTYTQLKTQRQIIDRPRSDHASFNQYGYPAIHCRENLNVNNPHYHTIGDTIGGGFNSLDFCTEVIKASVATVASLAQPISIGITEEKMNKANFLVIPNPTYRIGQFRLPKTNEKIKIKIYDIAGKIKIVFDVLENTERFDIDLSRLNSGVYFVELIMAKIRYKNKIVIR